MDDRLGPDEGCCVGIIGLDEGIDVLPELGNGGEGSAAQRLSGEDREPDFDLIEPRGAGRREVEVDVGMTLEPAVVLWLVGLQIVEDDVDLLAPIVGDDLVHKVEELDPPTQPLDAVQFMGMLAKVLGELRSLGIGVDRERTGAEYRAQMRRRVYRSMLIGARAAMRRGDAALEQIERHLAPYI